MFILLACEAVALYIFGFILAKLREGLFFRGLLKIRGENGGEKNARGDQVDNLAKIPVRSCQDLNQDPVMILPRS